MVSPAPLVLSEDGLREDMKRIGITCSYPDWPEDEKTRIGLGRYVDAVADAGGQGELLWLPEANENGTSLEQHLESHAERVADQLDGLILGGGNDLPPAYYGEAERPDANLKLVPVARPIFEKALLKEMLERQKPVLGICYGCQFLNVYQGGSLIQDIPSQWPEPITHGDSRHVVQVSPGSKLHQLTGMTEFESRSSHHQAVARLAGGAVKTAKAPDNVIEALEFPENPFCIGVQWHPECDRDSVATQRLFKGLVAACA